MKKLIALVAIFLAASIAWADTSELDEVMIKAFSGEYQSQRNLAYGYAAWPYPGQRKEPVRGCAWYLVIKKSKHRQYNSGDDGNIQVYCDQLSAKDQEVAKSLATEYMQAIAKTKKSNLTK